MAISVSYSELNGWPRTEWQGGEFDAERRIFVAWSDRVTFLTELDTYPNNLYPYSDGPSGAIVRRAKIHPFGRPIAEASLANYEWAIIQVWHSTRGPQWDTSLGALIDEKLFPAYQYKIVSAQKLRWKSDSKIVESKDEPRLDDTLYEYHVAYSRLSGLPSWVLTRPGICNSNTVAGKVIPLTFAPYTLKYNGCFIEATWSLGRTAKYDVTAKFLFKSSGWNTFWRPDGGTGGGGGWEFMATDQGDDYIQHQPINVNL